MFSRKQNHVPNLQYYIFAPISKCLNKNPHWVGSSRPPAQEIRFWYLKLLYDFTRVLHMTLFLSHLNQLTSSYSISLMSILILPFHRYIVVRSGSDCARTSRFSWACYIRPPFSSTFTPSFNNVRLKYKLWSASCYCVRLSNFSTELLIFLM
jgi:hypothetical protein